MTKVTATLSNFRQSPRKMRLVANLIKGKKVSDALVHLDFVTKRASNPIKNLVASALANAKAQEISTENLVVKTVRVDGGKILYRRRPASRGSAHPIRKRTSLIYVELAEAETKNKKTKVIKEKSEKTPVKEEKTTKKPKTKETKKK